MNKWQTQQEFWGQFGIPAIDESGMTEGLSGTYPRITYQAFNGVIGQIMPITASIWYRSPSWQEISLKADEIMVALKYGVVVKVDNGYLWLRLPETTAFAQRLASGSEDEMVKRIYLTIEAESLTAD